MHYSFEGRNYNFSSSLPECYDFEKLIDNKVNLRWMKEHWHYSIYLSAAYLILIFSLQKYMKSRPPFQVNHWMVMWNFTLGMFSLLATLRGIYILGAARNDINLKFLICDNIVLRHVPAITFWGWIYVYFKAFQLIDTLFIVLHKGKLMFLHCYHHAATLVLAWYMTAKEVSALATLAYTNIMVHSIMYTYFAFKASGYKVPRSIAMIITTLQTSQMAIGVMITAYAYWLVRRGEKCDSPSDALAYAFCVYLSYGLLFCHLFYNSFIKPYSSTKKNV